MSPTWVARAQPAGPSSAAFLGKGLAGAEVEQPGRSGAQVGWLQAAAYVAPGGVLAGLVLPAWPTQSFQGFPQFGPTLPTWTRLCLSTAAPWAPLLSPPFRRTALLFSENSPISLPPGRAEASSRGGSLTPAPGLCGWEPARALG